jgi:cyclic beta-1,2-glucan synthetase
MPKNTHLEVVSAEAERLRRSNRTISDLHVPLAKATELAGSFVWLPEIRSSRTFSQRLRALRLGLRNLLAELESAPREVQGSDDFQWLSDNPRFLYSELQVTVAELKTLKKLPHVRTRPGMVVPRVAALAEGWLEAVDFRFSPRSFTSFIQAFQEKTALEMAELGALVPAQKLILLEQVVMRGHQLLDSRDTQTCGVGTCIRSLREVSQTPWKDILEPLIVFDDLLRQDPAGSYAQMDFNSRELYRRKLVNIAAHSDFTELEVAREALALAKDAQHKTYNDPRIALREAHIGYYLVEKGAAQLSARVGYSPPLLQQTRDLLLRFPDEFFLPGIEILTLAIVSAIVWPLTEPHSSPALIVLAMLVLLLPSSQSAVQLVNYLITALLPPQILPKLDFSQEVPSDCATMVAVPSLLLHEKQVRGLVDDLEVRFLGNHHANLYFALLTDLPDSRETAREDSPLVELCAELIRKLNEKYASQSMGSFFLFHRHRIYNPREKSWMGWERKRGKLLDFNKLLRGQFDSFPVKVGDLSVLPSIRYVITLDSDTELPRGSAQRMIGAMAHPLNRAVIDREKRLVVAGYGILQPRVGVSVQSTALSRLAAIYAGETGFDIYTRAVSDVYQDLYGEGSFTGKGIYEVDTVLAVLDRRFPRNALLSHDLIEGAYARAGLTSDIEVIEDYPSHYNAHNRRKHRWLRGDWQIAGWLFSEVPDELGARVSNPISLISRWKILDNLRRSLVEPSVFLLLVFGWLVLSGPPGYWTLATLFILFTPAWCQFVFTLLRAVFSRKLLLAREALGTLYAANVSVFLNLTFLPHQTLLSLDAVFRAVVRHTVTRQHLLEWETAAEAELGTARRAPADSYLYWTPALAFGLGGLIWFVRPHALSAAAPLLLLWAGSQLVSTWLNRPSVALRNAVGSKDQTFIRQIALRTWRYFAEFSTEEHNWLIPDNVQEEPPALAARFSPTNLGLLLNARQVAHQLGYITDTEFTEQTLRTLAVISDLPKHRGHLLNWYDTRTLQPLAPFFVSSVDSGNLLASLWTLQQGCMDRLRQPAWQPQLGAGLLDHLRLLTRLGALPRKQLSVFERQFRSADWLPFLLDLAPTTFDEIVRVGSKAKHASEVRWFGEQARLRLLEIQEAVRSTTPWLLPEFAILCRDLGVRLELMDGVPLERLGNAIDKLAERLVAAMDGSAKDQSPVPEKAFLYEKLAALLPECRSQVMRRITEFQRIAGEAGRLADDMEFGFLLNQSRKLMSVGLDAESGELHTACYDLLATESRTAVFAAIAKDDIPQESWFLLGRAHTLDQGHPVLLSWTGTMFEYLMPNLWMRSYPNTLLDRSRIAVVRSQQAYGDARHIPWGISESAYSKLDEAGNYQYHAFGLPRLALREADSNALVVSPYSTMLALNVDPVQALQNLQRMADLGWFASYGFYEAADYLAPQRRFRRRRCQLVKCWMAHHQGMSLLSIANFLHDNVIQRWFHSDRRVQATELLLHEKPVSHVGRGDLVGRNTAA